MVRRTTYFILACAALATTHAAATPIDPGQVKAAIQLLYDKENIATANGDAGGSVAYVSANYIAVDDKGKRMCFHELFGHNREIVRDASSIQVGSIIRSCRMEGNKAVVQVDSEVRIVYGTTPRSSTGLTDVHTALETWIMTKTGWRLLYSRIVTRTVEVDGVRPASVAAGTL